MSRGDKISLNHRVTVLSLRLALGQPPPFLRRCPPPLPTSLPSGSGANSWILVGTEVAWLLAQRSFQTTSLAEYRPVMGLRRTPGFLPLLPPLPPGGTFCRCWLLVLVTSWQLALWGMLKSISWCSGPLTSEVGAMWKVSLASPTSLSPRPCARYRYFLFAKH